MEAYDLAGEARRILAAVEAGKLTDLEAELYQPLRAPDGLPSEAAERWELLEAIAAEMRRAFRRMRLHAATQLEGIEVNTRLLRHLAGNSPPAVT
ncbi:MAG TPA: hypothetical protein PLA43_17125 [Bryobacteraceae bacterium]|nr:hypothetical protein [Bryobacteraceae bacterium]HOQ45468.1 hypothetical protein [Bryobacteraceae bacterium]HPQ15719.1 hypothetical protein [Bryobacteraceae bacterium]HPU73676.1 hypothetical protein [Bryobacteraceae bacterium]